MSNIHVAVRVRPLNDKEKDDGSKEIVQVNKNVVRIENIKVVGVPEFGDSRTRVREFTFDHCYDGLLGNAAAASQAQVFEDVGTEVLHNAFDGFNACVFAYGQTGTGKTHTMMGYPGDVGLIPRICEGLFSRVTECASENVTCRIDVSYFEIYNERVRDLLQPELLKQNENYSLKVREHPKDGPYVKDLSWNRVKNNEEIQALLDRGNEYRVTAETYMHGHSSRSHAIVAIHFTQARLEENRPSEIVSKIHLVDLAGSERADPSSKPDFRKRLTEGSNINKSLVTLGYVIKALAERSLLSWPTGDMGSIQNFSSSGGGESQAGSSPAGPNKQRVPYIPYRDSVLTWLLKDSLGGNSKTVMIATITPASQYYSETISTLRYAQRAKTIVNKPTINEDTNVALIRELRREIGRLHEMLATAQMPNNSQPGDIIYFVPNLQGEYTGPFEQGGGGNLVSLPEAEDSILAERLHENEEMAKQLTESWMGKWASTHDIMKESDLSIRGLRNRSSSMGVMIDSQLPYLVGMDDDVLSTGIVIFHLKEGETTVGREDAAAQPDIVLEGPSIEREHCMLEHAHGEVLIHPCPGAMCAVQGVECTQPTKLSQGDYVVLGGNQVFRFNNPVQAAKLREHRRSQGSLNALNTSHLSFGGLSRASSYSSIGTDDANFLSPNSQLGRSYPNYAAQDLCRDLEKRYQTEQERMEEATNELERLKREHERAEELREVKEEEMYAMHEQHRADIDTQKQHLARLVEENERARHKAEEEVQHARDCLNKEKQAFQKQLDEERAKLKLLQKLERQQSMGIQTDPLSTQSTSVGSDPLPVGTQSSSAGCDPMSTESTSVDTDLLPMGSRSCTAGGDAMSVESQSTGCGPMSVESTSVGSDAPCGEGMEVGVSAGTGDETQVVNLTLDDLPVKYKDGRKLSANDQLSELEAEEFSKRMSFRETEESLAIQAEDLEDTFLHTQEQIDAKIRRIQAEEQQYKQLDQECLQDIAAQSEKVHELHKQEVQLEVYIQENEELLSVQTDIPRPLRTATSEMFLLEPDEEDQEFLQKTASMHDMQAEDDEDGEGQISPRSRALRRKSNPRNAEPTLDSREQSVESDISESGNKRMKPDRKITSIAKEVTSRLYQPPEPKFKYVPKTKEKEIPKTIPRNKTYRDRTVPKLDRSSPVKVLRDMDRAKSESPQRVTSKRSPVSPGKEIEHKKRSTSAPNKNIVSKDRNTKGLSDRDKKSKDNDNSNANVRTKASKLDSDKVPSARNRAQGKDSATSQRQKGTKSPDRVNVIGAGRLGGPGGRHMASASSLASVPESISETEEPTSPRKQDQEFGVKKRARKGRGSFDDDSFRCHSAPDSQSLAQAFDEYNEHMNMMSEPTETPAPDFNKSVSVDDSCMAAVTSDSNNDQSETVNSKPDHDAKTGLDKDGMALDVTDKANFHVGTSSEDEVDRADKTNENIVLGKREHVDEQTEPTSIPSKKSKPVTDDNEDINNIQESGVFTDEMETDITSENISTPLSDKNIADDEQFSDDSLDDADVSVDSLEGDKTSKSLSQSLPASFFTTEQPMSDDSLGGNDDENNDKSKSLDKLGNLSRSKVECHDLLGEGKPKDNQKVLGLSAVICNQIDITDIPVEVGPGSQQTTNDKAEIESQMDADNDNIPSNSHSQQPPNTTNKNASPLSLSVCAQSNIDITDSRSTDDKHRDTSSQDTASSDNGAPVNETVTSEAGENEMLVDSGIDNVEPAECMLANSEEHAISPEDIQNYIGDIVNKAKELAEQSGPPAEQSPNETSESKLKSDGDETPMETDNQSKQSLSHNDKLTSNDHLSQAKSSEDCNNSEMISPVTSNESFIPTVGTNAPVLETIVVDLTVDIDEKPKPVIEEQECNGLDGPRQDEINTNVVAQNLASEMATGQLQSETSMEQPDREVVSVTENQTTNMPAKNIDNSANTDTSGVNHEPDTINIHNGSGNMHDDSARIDEGSINGALENGIPIGDRVSDSDEPRTAVSTLAADDLDGTENKDKNPNSSQCNTSENVTDHEMLGAIGGSNDSFNLEDHLKQLDQSLSVVAGNIAQEMLENESEWYDYDRNEVSDLNESHEGHSNCSEGHMELEVSRTDSPELEENSHHSDGHMELDVSQTQSPELEETQSNTSHTSEAETQVDEVYDAGTGKLVYSSVRNGVAHLESILNVVAGRLAEEMLENDNTDNTCNENNKELDTMGETLGVAEPGRKDNDDHGTDTLVPGDQSEGPETQFVNEGPTGDVEAKAGQVDENDVASKIAGSPTTPLTADCTQSPMDTSQSPMDTSQSPMDTSQQAMDTSQQAMDTSQQAMDTSQQAMDTSQQAMDTSQQVMDTSQQAMDSLQSVLMDTMTTELQASPIVQSHDVGVGTSTEMLYGAEAGSQGSESFSDPHEELQVLQDALDKLNAKPGLGPQLSTARRATRQRVMIRQQHRDADSDGVCHMSDEAILPGTQTSRPNSSSRRRKKPAKISDKVKLRNKLSSDDYDSSENDSVYSEVDSVDNLEAETNEGNADDQKGYTDGSHGVDEDLHVNDLDDSTEADDMTSRHKKRRKDGPASARAWERRDYTEVVDGPDGRRTVGIQTFGHRPRHQVADISDLDGCQGNNRLTMVTSPISLWTSDHESHSDKNSSSSSAGMVKKHVTDLENSPRSNISLTSSNLGRGATEMWSTSETDLRPLNHFQDDLSYVMETEGMCPGASSGDYSDPASPMSSVYMRSPSGGVRLIPRPDCSTPTNMHRVVNISFPESQLQQAANLSDDTPVKFEVTVHEDNTNIHYNVEKTEYKTYALKNQNQADQKHVPDSITVNLTEQSVSKSEEKSEKKREEEIIIYHPGNEAVTGDDRVVIERSYRSSSSSDREVETVNGQVKHDNTKEYKEEDEAASAHCLPSTTENVANSPIVIKKVLKLEHSGVLGATSYSGCGLDPQDESGVNLDEDSDNTSDYGTITSLDGRKGEKSFTSESSEENASPGISPRASKVSKKRADKQPESRSQVSPIQDYMPEATECVPAEASPNQGLCDNIDEENTDDNLPVASDHAMDVKEDGTDTSSACTVKPAEADPTCSQETLDGVDSVASSQKHLESEKVQPQHSSVQTNKYDNVESVIPRLDLQLSPLDAVTANTERRLSVSSADEMYLSMEQQSDTSTDSDYRTPQESPRNQADSENTVASQVEDVFIPDFCEEDNLQSTPRQDGDRELIPDQAPVLTSSPKRCNDVRTVSVNTESLPSTLQMAPLTTSKVDHIFGGVNDPVQTESLRHTLEKKIERLQHHVRSLSDSAISSDYTDGDSASMSPRGSRVYDIDKRIPGERRLLHLDASNYPNRVFRVAQSPHRLADAAGNAGKSHFKDSGNVYDDDDTDTETKTDGAHAEPDITRPTSSLKGHYLPVATMGKFPETLVGSLLSIKPYPLTRSLSLDSISSIVNMPPQSLRAARDAQSIEDLMNGTADPQKDESGSMSPGEIRMDQDLLDELYGVISDTSADQLPAHGKKAERSVSLGMIESSVGRELLRSFSENDMGEFTEDPDSSNSSNDSITFVFIGDNNKHEQQMQQEYDQIDAADVDISGGEAVDYEQDIADDDHSTHSASEEIKDIIYNNEDPELYHSIEADEDALQCSAETFTETSDGLVQNTWYNRDPDEDSTPLRHRFGIDESVLPIAERSMSADNLPRQSHMVLKDVQRSQSAGMINMGSTDAEPDESESGIFPPRVYNFTDSEATEQSLSLQTSDGGGDQTSQMTGSSDKGATGSQSQSADFESEQNNTDDGGNENEDDESDDDDNSSAVVKSICSRSSSIEEFKEEFLIEYSSNKDRFKYTSKQNAEKAHVDPQELHDSEHLRQVLETVQRFIMPKPTTVDRGMTTEEEDGASNLVSIGVQTGSTDSLPRASGIKPSNNTPPGRLVLPALAAPFRSQSMESFGLGTSSNTLDLSDEQRNWCTLGELMVETTQLLRRINDRLPELEASSPDDQASQILQKWQEFSNQTGKPLAEIPPAGLKNENDIVAVLEKIIENHPQQCAQSTQVEPSNEEPIRKSENKKAELVPGSPEVAEEPVIVRAVKPVQTANPRNLDSVPSGTNTTPVGSRKQNNPDEPTKVSQPKPVQENGIPSEMANGTQNDPSSTGKTPQDNNPDFAGTFLDYLPQLMARLGIANPEVGTTTNNVPKEDETTTPSKNQQVPKDDRTSKAPGASNERPEEDLIQQEQMKGLNASLQQTAKKNVPVNKQEPTRNKEKSKQNEHSKPSENTKPSKNTKQNENSKPSENSKPGETSDRDNSVNSRPEASPNSPRLVTKPDLLPTGFTLPDMPEIVELRKEHAKLMKNLRKASDDRKARRDEVKARKQGTSPSSMYYNNTGPNKNDPSSSSETESSFYTDSDTVRSDDAETRISLNVSSDSDVVRSDENEEMKSDTKIDTTRSSVSSMSAPEFVQIKIQVDPTTGLKVENKTIKDNVPKNQQKKNYETPAKSKDQRKERPRHQHTWEMAGDELKSVWERKPEAISRTESESSFETTSSTEVAMVMGGKMNDSVDSASRPGAVNPMYQYSTDTGDDEDTDMIDDVLEDVVDDVLGDDVLTPRAEAAMHRHHPPSQLYQTPAHSYPSNREVLRSPSPEEAVIIPQTHTKNNTLPTFNGRPAAQPKSLTEPTRKPVSTAPVEEEKITPQTRKREHTLPTSVLKTKTPEPEMVSEDDPRERAGRKQPVFIRSETSPKYKSQLQREEQRPVSPEILQPNEKVPVTYPNRTHQTERPGKPEQPIVQESPINPSNSNLVNAATPKLNRFPDVTRQHKPLYPETEKIDQPDSRKTPVESEMEKSELKRNNTIPTEKEIDNILEKSKPNSTATSGPVSRPQGTKEQPNSRTNSDTQTKPNSLQEPPYSRTNQNSKPKDLQKQPYSRTNSDTQTKPNGMPEQPISSKIDSDTQTRPQGLRAPPRFTDDSTQMSIAFSDTETQTENGPPVNGEEPILPQVNKPAHARKPGTGKQPSKDTTPGDKSTKEIRDDLEKLQNERQHILDLLGLSGIPNSMTVELLEAKLNYCIGQTDMLLDNLEDNLSDDGKKPQPDEQKTKDYISKYREDLKKSKQDIDDCRKQLNMGSGRGRGATRGRKPQRRIDFVNQQRQAAIEAFKLERMREQQDYARSHPGTPLRGNTPFRGNTPLKGNTPLYGNSPVVTPRSDRSRSSSPTCSPCYMSPREHKAHLVDLRRQLIKDVVEEEERHSRSCSPSLLLSPRHTPRTTQSPSPSRQRSPSNQSMGFSPKVSFSEPNGRRPASIGRTPEYSPYVGRSSDSQPPNAPRPQPSPEQDPSVEPDSRGLCMSVPMEEMLRRSSYSSTSSGRSGSSQPFSPPRVQSDPRLPGSGASPDTRNVDQPLSLNLDYLQDDESGPYSPYSAYAREHLIPNERSNSPAGGVLRGSYELYPDHSDSSSVFSGDSEPYSDRSGHRPGGPVLDEDAVKRLRPIRASDIKAKITSGRLKR